MKEKFSPPLDPGIKKAVQILRKHGVETFESCEGGRGHAYPEPTIAFEGEYADGFRAFSVAVQHNLPVFYLRRVYRVEENELKGPWWELVFTSKNPKIPESANKEGGGSEV